MSSPRTFVVAALAACLAPWLAGCTSGSIQVTESTLSEDATYILFGKVAHEPTSRFSVNDEKVSLSVILGKNFVAHGRPFKVEWFFPNGRLYMRGPAITEFGSHEVLLTGMRIRGEAPSRYPGTWKVRLSLEKRVLLTREFDIVDPARPNVGMFAGHEEEMKPTMRGDGTTVEIGPEGPMGSLVREEADPGWDDSKYLPSGEVVDFGVRPEGYVAVRDEADPGWKAEKYLPSDEPVETLPPAEPSSRDEKEADALVTMHAPEVMKITLPPPSPPHVPDNADAGWQSDKYLPSGDVEGFGERPEGYVGKRDETDKGWDPDENLPADARAQPASAPTAGTSSPEPAGADPKSARAGETVTATGPRPDPSVLEASSATGWRPLTSRVVPAGSVVMCPHPWSAPAGCSYRSPEE